MATLSQSVTVPSGTAKGVYYVGLSIVADSPGSDTNLGNNALAEATITPIYLTSLTGTVTYGSSTKSVAIRSTYLGGSTPIFDDRATWIVIHGRNSSPSVNTWPVFPRPSTDIRDQNQVLMVDWSAAAASGLFGGSGENYIIPVSFWMAAKLSSVRTGPQRVESRRP